MKIAKTIFKKSLSLVGLSQSQAAAQFGVSGDTVKSWCAGRNRPPKIVWYALASQMTGIIEEANTLESAIDLAGIDSRQWPEIFERSDNMAEAIALLIAIEKEAQKSACS